MSDELVKVSKKEITTTSIIVADKFGKTHRRVLQTIDQLYANIQDLTARNGAVRSISNYTIEAKYRIVRGREFKSYEMNRKMFSLLVMSFTGNRALQWKMNFLDAFDLMERALLNQNNLEWKEQRNQGKQIRKDETTAIKEFIEYAKDQGSKNAKMYYINITKATYKALSLIQGQKPQLRDTLDMLELNHLITAENIAMLSLRKNMNEGEHYKVIFVNVKRDIERFASSLLLDYNTKQLGNK